MPSSQSPNIPPQPRLFSQLHLPICSLFFFFHGGGEGGKRGGGRGGRVREGGGEEEFTEGEVFGGDVAWEGEEVRARVGFVVVVVVVSFLFPCLVFPFFPLLTGLS